MDSEGEDKHASLRVEASHLHVLGVPFRSIPVGIPCRAHFIRCQTVYLNQRKETYCCHYRLGDRLSDLLMHW